MEAGMARFEQRHVVVIGGAAHEGDDVLRAVRELHPEDACVEIHLPVDVGCEEQHVSEPARRHLQVSPRRSPDGLSRSVAGPIEGRRRLHGDGGESFLPHIEEVAVGIAEPETTARRILGRVYFGHAGLADGVARAREVLAGGAEAEMVEPFAPPLVEQHAFA